MTGTRGSGSWNPLIRFPSRFFLLMPTPAASPTSLLWRYFPRPNELEEKAWQEDRYSTSSSLCTSPWRRDTVGRRASGTHSAHRLHIRSACSTRRDGTWFQCSSRPPLWSPRTLFELMKFEKIPEPFRVDDTVNLPADRWRQIRMPLLASDNGALC